MKTTDKSVDTSSDAALSDSQFTVADVLHDLELTSVRHSRGAICLIINALY
jgi:hypothetical protein